MKKVFKKNQIIITALAVMIAVAGYINYSDSKLKTQDAAATDSDGAVQETVDINNVVEDIDSLDYDLTDEIAEAAETEDANTDEGQETEDASSDTPGEAVLTGASTYVAQAKISREQIRSQNKETLLEVINNAELTEEERQGAVESMVSMTDYIEKESAAETLLEAKGFQNIVVNLTGDSADVMVPSADLDTAQLAQIEDCVTRKTGVAPENIVITPMNETQEE